MYSSTRFSDYKVFLFEETAPADHHKEQTSEGLSDIGDVIGFILIFGLLGSVGYYLYLKKKNSANTPENQSLSRQIEQDQIGYQNDFRSM